MPDGERTCRCERAQAPQEHPARSRYLPVLRLVIGQLLREATEAGWIEPGPWTWVIGLAVVALERAWVRFRSDRCRRDPAAPADESQSPADPPPAEDRIRG